MRPEIISLFLISLIALSRLQNGGDPTPFFLYLGLLVGVLWLRGRRERKRRDFVHQLKSCRKELRSGGTVVIDGHLLRYNSVISTFYLNFGGVFCSVRIPTHYRVTSEQNDHHHDSFYCSLGSLLTGWWAIPAGPLQTITTIIQNISGGERLSVAELIDLPLLKRTAARRFAIEQHLAEKRLEAAEKKIEPAAGDFGPGSAGNRELIRGSRTFGETAENVAWSRQQYMCELNQEPPGAVMLDALKSRLAGAIDKFKQQARHKQENRAKHSAIVDRTALHPAVRS